MADEKNIVCGPPEVEGPVDISYSEYMFRQMKLHGDAAAQICNDTGEVATYAQILQRSVNLAASLRKLGVKKGDVVTISSENRFEYTVSAIAIMFAGAVNSTLNIMYSKDELIHALNLFKPKIVICSPTTLNKIVEAVTDIPTIEKLIVFGNKPADSSVEQFDNLLKKTVDIHTFKLTETGIHDPLVLMCSSGTTGLPKGVILTHHSITISTGHLKELMTTLNSLGGRKCLLLILPWFHVYGFLIHLMSITLKLQYVFMRRFEEEPFLQAIQKYKVSLTMLVPPLMVFLAKHPLVDKYDLSSLEEILCGAAPLSKDVQLMVINRTGVKGITQVYGMTETTLTVTLGEIGKSNKYGSCGKAVPVIKIKVLDLKTGEALGPNKEGELCFKGPTMMAGYIGDAASTKAIIDSDGWLHSGDVGYYDEEYFFYIIDRIKELIKYNAYQIPPAELEAILLQHPQIKDAGVVGLPGKKAGELPFAFIVRRPGSNVTAEDIVNIVNFVALRTSPIKRLRGGVTFIEEITKNPSGKVLRKYLKNLLVNDSCHVLLSEVSR